MASPFVRIAFIAPELSFVGDARPIAVSAKHEAHCTGRKKVPRIHQIGTPFSTDPGTFPIYSVSKTYSSVAITAPRRNPSLDPIHNSTQHVEMIKRRTAAAVVHPGHEKLLTPGSHFLLAAIPCNQGLVVFKRIQSEKSRVAIPMEEHQLAATPGACAFSYDGLLSRSRIGTLFGAAVRGGVSKPQTEGASCRTSALMCCLR